MPNDKQNLNWSSNFTFPITLFRTIPICITVIIIMGWGSPDIIDGIVNVLQSLAEYLKCK